MASVALSGRDTIIINNRVLNDLGDNDVAHLTYPNEIASVKTGKNGNSIYGFNASGKQCDFELRVIRGSSDDKFLNNLLISQNANFPGFPLMTGEMVKNMGDGAGNISADTYIFNGGVFTHGVDAKSNVEGDTEQSLSIYKMKFTNTPRVIT